MNTVSHSVPRRFPRKSRQLSHSARTAHTVCRTADRPAPLEPPKIQSKRPARGARRLLLERVTWLAVGAILITLLAAAGRTSGMILVDTDSSCPVGIYRVVQRPVTRGELVEACLPDAIAAYGRARGYLGLGGCPDGSEPMIKVIGATSGDRVDLSSESVWVNAAGLPQTATRLRDSRGREVSSIERGSYKTRANEVWLFGVRDARSWDSRYFGPVPRSDVVGAVEPVLTVGSFAVTK